MKTIQPARMVAVATGLVISGLVMAGVASTGCDVRQGGPEAAAAPDVSGITEQLVSDALDARKKLAANHNETFLAGPDRA